MQYARKMGAYGLTVAAAFALALAVLMSAATTTEAATITLKKDKDSVTASPGDTVRIMVSSAFAQVHITSGTAMGSFASGGGQSVSCPDAGTCDKDPTALMVAVDLSVDKDSPEGYILLSVGSLGGTTSTKIITVSKAKLAGSLTLKASPTTIAASDSMTLITVTVKNASSPAVGLGGQTVSLITTLGVFDKSLQAVNASTNKDGTTEVKLNGTGRGGTATVTATLGDLTATVDVIIYGAAKKVTAAAAQSSLEIGGATHVLVTVTDDAGNPVTGASTAANATVKGPKGVSSFKPVVLNHGVGVDNSSPANNDSKDAGDIPACSAGTNAKGLCAIEVYAPKKDNKHDKTTDTADASRGVNTISVKVGALKAVTTAITVGGAPSVIATDAPGRVDPLSETKVTITVRDDQGVLVGKTGLRVRRIEGGGLVEAASATTKDGVGSFVYFAPSTDGTATFLIDAGPTKTAVRKIVTVTIGAEAMPEPMPEPEPTLTGSGALRIFSGGSVEQLAAAAEAACPGGADVWLQDAEGTWRIYGTTRPAFVNGLFTAAFADGFSGHTAVFVGSCAAAAMMGEN